MQARGPVLLRCLCSDCEPGTRQRGMARRAAGIKPTAGTPADLPGSMPAWPQRLGKQARWRPVRAAPLLIRSAAVPRKAAAATRRRAAAAGAWQDARGAGRRGGSAGRLSARERRLCRTSARSLVLTLHEVISGAWREPVAENLRPRLSSPNVAARNLPRCSRPASASSSVLASDGRFCNPLRGSRLASAVNASSWRKEEVVLRRQRQFVPQAIGHVAPDRMARAADRGSSLLRPVRDGCPSASAALIVRGPLLNRVGKVVRSLRRAEASTRGVSRPLFRSAAGRAFPTTPCIV